MNAYILLDSDQSWRDDRAALEDWRRDMAAEHGLGCKSCPEWCDLYNVSIGVPMCGETFPRCELGRGYCLRKNGERKQKEVKGNGE